MHLAQLDRASQSSNRFRWTDVYFIWIALTTLLYGLYTAHFSRAWAISDWLINYQGGFVRRGLPGQGIFFLGKLLHVPPVPLVLLLCFFSYGVLLFTVRFLVEQSSGQTWVWLAVVSPATLAFPILDLSAGFRKELLYLAALAALLVLLRRGLLTNLQLSVYLACSLVAGTLSHEPLVCFAPYFAAALLLSGRRVVQVIAICLVPAVLGLGAAYGSATHLGDEQTAQKICASLGYQLVSPGREICSGGAIGYLAHTRESARTQTLAMMDGKRYLQIYPALAVLALLPLAWGSWILARTGRRKQIQWVWALALISFAGSLVLFVYAEDWGRWIYIHVLSLTLLLLFLDGQRLDEQRLDGQRGGRAREPEQRRASWRVAAVVGVALYATVWSLPCAVGPESYYGYGGLAHHLLQRSFSSDTERVRGLR